MVKQSYKVTSPFRQISASRRIMLWLALCLLSPQLLASAQPEAQVKVGIYPYPPYVEQNEEGEYYGIAISLIDLLNAHQQQYRFVPVPISPKRRYQAFVMGDYDIIFFENPAWGWQGIPVEISRPYQTDGEVYVALAEKNRDQQYFDDLSNKRMIGILGFHYGFAGFNADEQFLRQNFQMILSWTNEKNLSLLRERHGDIAVMSKAFLHRFFNENPQARDEFLISERYDQRYQHSALIRPGFNPGTQEINRFMDELKSNGKLLELFRPYGIHACSDISRETQAEQMQDVCLE
ncbi:substrate-binding periplasmic protein [Thalassolituus hydrocarboniclasticus]|uniref:Transporter substrate-binding domain-containing protein n=1 Tax=Thalassolituus hydrocarboniclasticus TaxID=2742796 RepID=A0ABY6A9R3_9GAMM|nr:ABC transporter substrate-binding protein [Thalassolituus hydrocarboniclasticus]UXD86996.1 transporter substrate-binding domain-containing protein [Thalassolituus hydrocarboniclasticus]